MTPLEILGLEAGASVDEIERRWRELRSELHPDHGGDAERFHEASNAYVAARHEASEPRPCEACGGSGRVGQARGFAQVTTACQVCGGSGEAA